MWILAVQARLDPDVPSGCKLHSISRQIEQDLPQSVLDHPANAMAPRG